MVFNSKVLTVEDGNSIISHFAKGFVDYYTLDTRLLTTVDTWFAWDFIDVYRVTGSITFSIKNSLWTGGYRVINSNIESPTVSVSDNEITVAGTGLEWVVLVLELSPEFALDEPLDLEFTPEYTPIIRPFYEDVALTMGFLDDETPVVGLDVTDLITGDSLTTDSDGLVTVLSELDKAGDYDYTLEAENNNVDVDYNFPYARMKCELPIQLLNENIHRDKQNVIEFKFLFDNEYNITPEMLFENNLIQLVVDNVVYTVNEYENDTFNFIVPVGSTNRLNMNLKIGGNEYLDKYNVVYNVDCDFVTIMSSSDLKQELESELSASVVVFGGNELGTTINIIRDVVVRFTDVCTSNLDSVFTVSDGATLSLEDCNFAGKCLVVLDDGNVRCDNCIIQHSIDTIIKGMGTVVIRGCSFIDNSNVINVTGDVDVRDTLFDLSDISYYDDSTPAFISVYGELNLDYSDFSLDLDSLTSLGIGYVLLLAGKNSYVNGVSVKDLMSNESFPMRKNTSEINVGSTNYILTGKDNKAFIWNIEDTNTVYSNHLYVEYVGD